MTCKEYKRRAKAWNNDRVTPAEVAKSKEHHESCPACEVWHRSRLKKDLRKLAALIQR